MTATGAQTISQLSKNVFPAESFNKPDDSLQSPHLMASANSYDVAKAMEKSRQSLDEKESSGKTSTDAATRVQAPTVTTTDEFALCFDIDGVLMRGGKPIPAAVEAMKYINGENPHGTKM